MWRLRTGAPSLCRCASECWVIIKKLLSATRTTSAIYIQMNLDISQWVNVRQATVVAVFLAYIINFVANWLAQKSKDELTIIRMKRVGSCLFPYGLAGLLSANLIQAGIFQACWAWVVLANLIAAHIVEFRELQKKRRKLIFNIYYLLLMVWYIGIVVDYFL